MTKTTHDPYLEALDDLRLLSDVAGALQDIARAASRLGRDALADELERLAAEALRIQRQATRHIGQGIHNDCDKSVGMITDVLKAAMQPAVDTTKR
jgi:hypothetical protein